MRYAIIVDGLVVNVIEADEDFIAQWVTGEVAVPDEKFPVSRDEHVRDGTAAQLDEKSPVAIKWAHDGEKFVEPEPIIYDGVKDVVDIADAVVVKDGKDGKDPDAVAAAEVAAEAAAAVEDLKP